MTKLQPSKRAPRRNWLRLVSVNTKENAKIIPNLDNATQQRSRILSNLSKQFFCFMKSPILPKAEPRWTRLLQTWAQIMWKSFQHHANNRSMWLKHHKKKHRHAALWRRWHTSTWPLPNLVSCKPSARSSKLWATIEASSPEWSLETSAESPAAARWR